MAYSKAVQSAVLMAFRLADQLAYCLVVLMADHLVGATAGYWAACLVVWKAADLAENLAENLVVQRVEYLVAWTVVCLAANSALHLVEWMAGWKVALTVVNLAVK